MLFFPLSNIKYKKNENLIKYYFNLNRDYGIFICENKKKIEWKRILDIKDSIIITDKGETDFCNVKKYCVTYKSGEILDISENTFDIPDSAYWIEPYDSTEYITLDDKDVCLESNEILIEYLSSDCPKPGYYKTCIKNNTNEKMYIVAFASYIKNSGKYEVSTITESMFSPEEFMNWYNCKKDYIEPGESVFDPNNYGEGCYWIYIFKNEDGKIKIVGKKK